MSIKEYQEKGRRTRMFCTHCWMARPQDMTPCANCGAPSPLLSAPQTGRSEYSGHDELPEEDTRAMPQAQSQAKQQSLLPVPYQEKRGMMAQFSMPGMGLQKAQQDITVQIPQQQECMLPALPDDNVSIVYVPPMYTKPRPIIPRYRAISGLLSVLIMTLLMCTGAGYYAKASGRLDYIRHVVGIVPPTSLSPIATSTLPDPPSTPLLGPGYAFIPSAGITGHVDPNNPYFAKYSETTFKVGQLIHVLYSVEKPKMAGVVKTLWYTNNHIYAPAISKTIPVGATDTGDSQMKYMEPCEGKVELYWNDQLAWTLFFVVRAK